MFQQHGHYYGAFFAILKAEQEHIPGDSVPFMKLKKGRISRAMDAQTMMTTLQMGGIDFEGLKKEMDSAFQRRKREDGT